MRRTKIAAISTQLLLLCGLVPVAAVTLTAPIASAALPTGFSEQVVVSGLVQPMAVEFSPDGRVFVAEKSGLVKVFDGLADTSPTIFADLRTKVFNQHDRGLMSLVLSPTFPTDPSVYVLYAHDAVIGGTAPRWGTVNGTNDVCPNPPGETADGCVISGRLSKLNAAVPGGAEQVLVEDWCQQYPSHSVGDLAFGPDGFLYASAGDGASYNFVDWGQDGNPRNPCGDPPTGVGGVQTVPTAEGGALRSQDIQTMGDPLGLDGTVIRIDPATGQGAPGNPMAGHADPNARRVIANGLRNPFRFAMRPGTSEVWIGDVGWSTWEEIDRIANPTDGTVDNFGWPCKEGTAPNDGYNNGLTMCTRINNNTVPTVNPHYTYQHGQPVVSGDGCSTGTGSSISGAAFYNGGAYPDSYDGAYFFADYSRRCVWTMLAGAGGVPNPATRAVFQQGIFPVDLTVGPNGDMYFVDIALGQVKRFRFNAVNQPPVASIVANPSQGPLPLTVSFTAAASADPEGGPLTYAWDLDDDDIFDDATGPTTSRTYTTAGSYDAAVRVSDASGQTDIARTVVVAGSTPPTATINTPGTSFTWGVGDPIAFSGSATDAEDGPLPASALSWRVVLQHCVTIDACHEHTLVGFDGVASGQFEGPDHEYPAYLEIRMTARDSTGVETTVSRRLDPKVATVTVDSSPPGLTATVSGKSGTTPFTTQAILGSQVTLSTAEQQTLGTTTYAFQSWSDGGPRAHNITASNTTYTATFAPISGSDPTLVAAYSFDEGAGTTLTDRSGNGHTGTLAGPLWSAAGRYGGALSFDGVNDLVTVNDTAKLDLTTGMTLQAWVRPTTSTGWRTAMLKERPGGLTYALYPAGSNQPSGYISSGPDHAVNGPTTLPTATWSHLAMTYDGTTMRLYVNGTQVATTARNVAALTSTSPLRLGGNTVWGEYFSGLLDNVRIHSRALTAAEIAADRDIPVAGDTAPPTAPTGLTAQGSLGTATLSWTAATDNVAVTGYQVHRSTTSGFTPSAGTLITTVTGTGHTDQGLAAGTYHYRVIARDGAGNLSPPSAQASATVTADTTPPSVSISTPAAGSELAGMVQVMASAADSGGVAGVQLRLDGQPLGAEDTAVPYGTTWDTRLSTNGTHTLTAVARDSAGNTATSAPVTVTVSNTAAPPGAPVASYNFDEGSGTTLNDRTGKGHTGTLAGPLWSAAGRYGGALSFDGTNDLVTIADANDLDLTSAMTLEGWVRPAGSADWRTVLLKEQPGGLNYALYSDNAASRPAGYIRVGSSDRGVTGPSAVPQNAWTHLAMTYDGTTMRLYVNGTQVSTAAVTGAAATSTSALRIGGNAVWGEYFNGLIDDVRVYGRVLTQPEISTDMNTPIE
ncbi:Glucose/arabinose dehydrogenase, beta-propeller fold [Actinokineospora alba]|uniref:Glucose/arabinose dehydrogenase, beta-propeller fold n=1 Tax=Actinokineospora alba TaxID=504798 RepID=A0A1H0UGH7_9PSEU|nr:LamG-like jellyroll fold domain-containing protein [Actinokineospora alba]TDP65125.1 glucose/arabinose dehydrogenase [Actinokineospora alba]SDH54650.1 Glucose/arabinose dehydrogenase, beta-propeller fold [Actinokineospora alba]SDP64966.1 Glucose/arabinose dehydrogenase, beta-propeller fold [Actinokineospora alba]